MRTTQEQKTLDPWAPENWTEEKIMERAHRYEAKQIARRIAQLVWLIKTVFAAVVTAFAVKFIAL